MKPTHCENCGEALLGRYCAQCGQSDADYDVPVREFATEFLSESFDLDSRLRRTILPLFFRPGLVPAEYVGGHRARFVPPVRLYVFASFAAFLILSFTSGPMRITTTGGEDASPLLGDTAAALDDLIAPPPVDSLGSGPPDPEAAVGAEPSKDEEASLSDRLGQGLQRVTEDPNQFTDAFLNRVAQAMFFLLPGFALLLKGLYRRRLYVHHLVFAVYFHSFAFLLIATAELVGAPGLPVVTAAAEAAVLWLPVYLFLAMRRFYRKGRLETLLRFGVLSVAYLALVSATILGLTLATLLTFRV